MAGSEVICQAKELTFQEGLLFLLILILIST